VQAPLSKTPHSKFLDEALFVVDASSYIFRAYYGLQTNLQAPDGTPTHATFAFVQMIRALANTFKTKKLVLVWDRKEPSFRAKIFKDYKANRSAPPEDLSLQIENTQKVMELWGYPQLSVAGFEADDVIASLVEKEKGNIVIVTADKDMLQLVSERTWCLDTRKNQWSNALEAKEKFGVSPEQIVDVQAIMGDSVDNIPGAPGIGPKGAAELIQHFGSLDKVLEEAKSRSQNLDKKYSDPLNGKKLKAIAENIELVELSKKLVELSKDVPYESIFLEKQHPPLVDELVKELSRLGFKRFVDEIQKASPVNEEKKETNSQYVCVQSLVELKNIFDKHSDKKILAFDTETFSLDQHTSHNLVGFSFAFDSTTAYYVPLRHKNGFNLDPAQSLNLAKVVLEEKTVIFHHGKFDWHQLEGEGVSYKGDYHDTLIASFILDVTGSHNLENLSERYLGAQPTRYDDIVKKGENFSDVSIKQATHYAAEDSLLTFQLWELFEKDLKEKNLYRLYNEVDRPLARVLFEMERNGVKIDNIYLHELYRDLEKERFKAEESAREILKTDGIQDFETINFASPKQLTKLLFEDLKLPVIKKGKTGPSTDVEVLEELSAQHPFPKVLLEIRELTKLLSTYIQPLPELMNKQTKRLHTHFSQTIAQTGRLASSEPNLQNIPIRSERGSRIRKAFIAEEGNSIYSVDYSQIELRFLAEVTQDKELTRAFREGADIHARTASLIFGKSESEITSDERRSAKTINFGIIYGQTAFGLAKTLGISRQDAQRFIESYFQSYAQLKTWMDGVVTEARQTGEVKTFLGRIRKLENINSKNPALRNFAERMAINSPLQGTSADLIKLAMIRVRDWIKENKAPVKVVLQIHDELLFEVKKGFEKDFYPEVKKILEDSEVFVPFTGKKLQTPLLTNHSFGPNWGEMIEFS
jgi:DNA polymerase-1